MNPFLAHRGVLMWPIEQAVVQARQLASRAAARARGDDELLACFAKSRDEASFEELVRRHAPLVLGVARRVTGDYHVAEDVLQATFLLLARKAAVQSWGRTVGPWLNAVAYRLAKKAQSRSRSAAVPAPRAASAESDPHQPLLWAEVRAALDEELARLPARLHDPLVLCWLQGHTRDEAARALGWSIGTLKRRLEQARELLRARLTQRGIVLGSVGSMVMEAGQLPASTIIETTRAVIAGEIRDSAAALLAPAPGVLAKTTVLIAALIAVIGFGTAWLVRTTPDRERVLGPEEPAQVTIDVSGDALPDGAVARLGTTRFRPGTKIQAMTFAPDGKQLALWARDWSTSMVDRLIVLDPADGKELKTVALPPNILLAMQWAMDGRGLAFVKADRRTYYLWEFTDATKPFPIDEKADTHTIFPGDIQVAAISPDGRWLATARTPAANAMQPIEIWGFRSGKRLADLRPTAIHQPTDPCGFVTFSADGRRLFAVTANEKAAKCVVLEVPGGKLLNSFDVVGPLDRANGIKSMHGRLVAHPDGKSISIAAADGSVHSYDWERGRETHKFMAHPEGDPNRFEMAGVNALAFSPDGKTLCTSSLRREFTIRDATSGAVRATRREIDAGNGFHFAFSSDGKQLAVAGAGTTACVQMVDASTGRTLHALPGHSGPISDVHVFPDGTAMTCGWDDRLRYWRLSDGRELKNRFLRIPAMFMYNPSLFTPDGRGLFAWHDQRLTFVDLASGNISSIAEKDAPPLFVSGQSVLYPGDGKIQQWDARTGKVRRTLTPPKNADMSPGYGKIVMSPDERVFIALSENYVQSGNLRYRQGSNISVHDTVRDTVVRNWTVPDAIFYCAVFSPSGEFLVVGGMSSSGGDVGKAATPLPISAKYALLLFDARSGEPILDYAPATQAPFPHYSYTAVAISPNSHLLAAADADGSIAVYELATGGLCRVYRGHRSLITQLKFTPDGKRLISTSFDMTGLVWDVGYAALAKPSPQESDRLWADLTRPEFPLAGPALAALAARPDALVALVKDRLPAAAKPDVDRADVLKAVGQLDDQLFAARERASATLGRLGRESLPLLREQLATVTTNERSTRLRRAIEQISRSPVASDHLRHTRVIAALKQVDTPAARTELERLAGGHTEADLTRRAKEALGIVP